MKWVTGSPLTFQRFSSEQNAGIYKCRYFERHPRLDRVIGSSKFCTRGTVFSKLLKYVATTCFMMSIINLADPSWISIHCDQQLLTQIVCIKDVISRNSTFTPQKDVVNKNYFCGSDAILVYDMCYEFCWVSNISSPEYVKKISDVDINIFKYILEAIALESKYLSAFVKRNISMLNTVTFVKHLDTVTFEKTNHMKGYLIYNSEKHFIHHGSHAFICSKGSHILFKYVCDGKSDCPDDTSDEDFCMCSASSQSKTCKTLISRKNLTVCSSVYYMTKNGHCLKYAHSEKIYKTLNIIHYLPKYSTKVTSKLTAFDKSKNDSMNESITKKNNPYTNYSECLTPGELPCGRDHDACYNMTSLCIYQLNFKHDLIPCKNGRHLEYCSTFLCDSMLKCSTVYCIPFSYVCNGRWDCPHGDDELTCHDSKACKNMFHCRSTRQICLYLGNICDGHNDCPLADDEMLCELKLVHCPTYCICLLYAVDCTALSDETFKIIYPFSYLFAYLSKFTLISMNTLINFKNAVVIKLPENKIISICDILIESGDWKCIILDLSSNLLKSLKNKCFSTTTFLKSLNVNGNLIEYLGQHCFYNLTKLRYLNVMHNPLIQLHSHFLMKLSLMIFSIDNISLLDIYPQAFDGSKIVFISTTYYHICCMAPINTVCKAFKPWYIACSDILPSLGMKLFYSSVSVIIFILNILSIILQISSYKANKSFSLIVISINGNDILCGMYLSYVWIADLYFSDSFRVKEESWRSGILCLTAFTTALFFTVLTECFLILLSLARLMVVIHPLNTRFKETQFIVKLLIIFMFFSVFFCVFIALIFKSTNYAITISICLPFLDPTDSQLIVKFIVWFTVVTQMATSVGILIMHCLLLNELTQNKVQKSKAGNNLPLIIQLIMITVSNILCWFPTACVYITAMFSRTYPIDLVIWTTVLGLPINSILNPLIFIVTTVRKMMKFETKVYTNRNVFNV